MEDGITRRSILISTAAIVSAAVVGLRSMGGRAAAPVQRVLARLPRASHPLAAPPVDPAATHPGLSPLFTPTGDFFRIDVASTPPAPSLDAWRLRIDGLVRHPREFTYDDLLAREIIEIDATLACVSNPVGGPLVGTARWRGIALASLIAEAEPLPDADEVLGHSVDDFSAGFPVAAARDALIALGMNGVPLPAEHGFPARIIVPALFGYVSAVKWLSRVELTRFDRAVGTWVPRGWAELGPMKLASRIDRPHDGDSVTRGRTIVAGVAWSDAHGIASVAVRIDDGLWQEASLGPDLGPAVWRQWWFAWDAAPGEHTLTVRAVDTRGTVQPGVNVDPAPDGAEGWHRVTVTVR